MEDVWGWTAGDPEIDKEVVGMKSHISISSKPGQSPEEEN
jgi:hypothetical protein